MRTAESYLIRLTTYTRKKQNRSDDGLTHDHFIKVEDFLKAIREAQRDAIQECAERAKIKTTSSFGTEWHKVDKESILSLLKEIEE